tara:strand:+ start:312 stop:665 length:354 start_codon:yes stop_codon:yes gene_type:complete
MSIKLALLKSGESLIADTKELISNEKICGYLFSNPHVVEHREKIVLNENENDLDGGDLEVSLTPWIIFSKDDKIPVSPDWLVTIVEPVKELKDLYEEKLNGESNQVSDSNKQRNLSE